MLHTIQEWETKKPFNVVFSSMKLEKGQVKRACGYETNSNIALTYDRCGHAYVLINPLESKMLKVDEDGECTSMTLDELQMLLPVPQSEYDIKW